MTADSTSGYIKTEIKDGVVSRCRTEKIYRHADVLEIDYEVTPSNITKFLRQFSIYPFPIERSCQHGQPIPEYNEQMPNNDAGGCFQILTIKQDYKNIK